MKFFGNKLHLLNTTKNHDTSCPKCRSLLVTQVWGSYNHILGIPFLSSKKVGKCYCENCKHSFDYEKMNDKMKLSFFELKEITKTPIWFYTGLVLIKIAVIIKILSNYW